MGRPKNPDPDWLSFADPEDLAEIDAIDAEAERLRNRLGELAYRRIRVTAKCRARAVAAKRKEAGTELEHLRKQLANGRKLTF